MKRSAFDEMRDQRTADETARGYSPELMCQAHGCPNRWSFDDGGSRTCSAHAAVTDRMLWPRITEEQQDAETDRARARGEPRQRAPHLSHAEKVEILERARRIGQPDQPKAWAYALKAREEQGERLTSAQRAMWRAAIGHRDTSDWIDGAGFKGIDRDKLPESMRPRTVNHSRAGARFAEAVS